MAQMSIMVRSAFFLMSFLKTLLTKTSKDEMLSYICDFNLYNVFGKNHSYPFEMANFQNKYFNDFFLVNLPPSAILIFFVQKFTFANPF